MKSKPLWMYAALTTVLATACGLFQISQPNKPKETTPPPTTKPNLEYQAVGLSDPLQETKPGVYRSIYQKESYLNLKSLQDNIKNQENTSTCRTGMFKEIARCVHFDFQNGSEISGIVSLPKTEDISLTNGTPRISATAVHGLNGNVAEAGLQWNSDIKAWTPYVISKKGAITQIYEAHLIYREITVLPDKSVKSEYYLHAFLPNQKINLSFGLGRLYGTMYTYPYMVVDGTTFLKKPLKIPTTQDYTNGSTIIRGNYGQEYVVTKDPWVEYKTTRGFFISMDLLARDRSWDGYNQGTWINQAGFNYNVGISFKDNADQQLFLNKGGQLKNLMTELLFITKFTNWGEFSTRDGYTFFNNTASRQPTPRPWVDTTKTAPEGMTHPAITTATRTLNGTTYISERVGFNQPAALDPNIPFTFSLQANSALSNLAATAETSTSPVDLTVSNINWNAESKVFTADISITNKTTSTLPAYRVLLSGVSPANTQLTNPLGYTSDSKPFLEYPELSAGQVAKQKWQWYVPSGQAFMLKAQFVAKQEKLVLQAGTVPSLTNDQDHQLTLNGQDFRAETAFFIESTRLEVKSLNATSATVVVPKGFLPSTYGLMAVNPNGDKSVLYPAFHVVKGQDPPAINPQMNPQSFISGYVVDYSNKQGIAGTKISIPGLQVTTNSDGYFLMQGVPVGQHAVRIEQDGYEPLYRNVDVTTNNQSSILKLAELEPSHTESTTIGAEGGMHYANNGSFIKIPPGALENPVDIKFTQLEAPTTLPQLPQDGYFMAFARLEPVGLTFHKPATLFLPLQEGMSIPNGTPIRITYYEPREARWVDDITSGVITTINGRQYLEYEINHFTWIGGLGAFPPVTVKGRLLDSNGRPLVGILTNYGVTDAEGRFTGTAPGSNLDRSIGLSVPSLDLEKSKMGGGGGTLPGSGPDGTGAGSAGPPVDFGDITVPQGATKSATSGVGSGDKSSPYPPSQPMGLQPSGSVPGGDDSSSPYVGPDPDGDPSGGDDGGGGGGGGGDPCATPDVGQRLGLRMFSPTQSRGARTLKVHPQMLPLEETEETTSNLLMVAGDQVQVVVDPTSGWLPNTVQVTFRGQNVSGTLGEDAKLTFDLSAYAVNEGETVQITGMLASGQRMTIRQTIKFIQSFYQVNFKLVELSDSEYADTVESITGDSDYSELTRPEDYEGDYQYQKLRLPGLSPGGDVIQYEIFLVYFENQVTIYRKYSDSQSIHYKRAGLLLPVFLVDGAGNFTSGKLTGNYFMLTGEDDGSIGYYPIVQQGDMTYISIYQLLSGRSAVFGRKLVKSTEVLTPVSNQRFSQANSTKPKTTTIPGTSGQAPKIIIPEDERSVTSLMVDRGWSREAAEKFVEMAFYVKQVESPLIVKDASGCAEQARIIESLNTVIRFVDLAAASGLPREITMSLLNRFSRPGSLNLYDTQFENLNELLNVVQSRISAGDLAAAKFLLISGLAGIDAKREDFLANLEVTKSEVEILTLVTPFELLGALMNGAKISALTLRELLPHFKEFVEAAIKAGKSAKAGVDDFIKWVTTCTGNIVSSNSFVADTLVSTPMGFVKISDIKTGDLVFSFNERLRHNEINPVTHVFVSEDPIITEVYIDNSNQKNEKITTTPMHPFYVINPDSKNVNNLDYRSDLSKNWVYAKDLKDYHKIKTISGDVGVSYVKNTIKNLMMYNLEVSSAHTFFVGSNQILVHNDENIHGDGTLKYGEGLSKYASKYRYVNSYYNGKNIAVFLLKEIVDVGIPRDQWNEHGILDIQTVDEGKKTLIMFKSGDNIMTVNEKGKSIIQTMHSEQAAKELLINKLKLNGSIVEKIYSERQPCFGIGTANCKLILRDSFPGVPIDYSFRYNFPEATKEALQRIKNEITSNIIKAAKTLKGC